MEMMQWKNPGSGTMLPLDLPLRLFARMGHTLLSTGGPLIDWGLVVKIVPRPASRQFRPIRGDFRFPPLMTSLQEY